MRCNWRRWLWGLIPLLAVTWAAIQVERGRIEQDLAEQAQQVLARSGLAWASVEVSGRDVRLVGRAIQDTEPVQAEEALRKLWGVRDVDNRASLPPKVEPFVWAARRRGNQIRLQGYVTDRATRRTVIGLTKAALPGFEVVDRMNVARGVPPADTWLAGLSFALKQLGSLKRGDVRFDDLALTISGEAEDTAGYRSVSAALKSGLPKGISLASAKITAPVVSPFTWSAQFAGGQLVLSGYVPGDAAKAELVAALKAAASGTNVVDRMEVAEGAPQGWANVATGVARELVRLDNGSAEMKDSAVTVAGLAADEAAGQQARAALKAAVPSGFKLADQIRVREVKPPEPAPKAEPPPTAEPAPPPAAESQPKQAAPAAPPAPETLPKLAAPAPQPQAEPQPPKPEVSAPTPPPAPEPQTKLAAPAPQPQAELQPPKPEVSAPTPPPAPEPQTKLAAPAPTLPVRPQPEPAAKAEPATKAAAAPPAPAPPVLPPQGPAAKTEPPVKTAAVPPAPAPPPSAPACEESLGKIVASGKILFERDSAALDGVSLETLDRLAAAAKTCPGVRIAVEGHADIEGTAEHNQRLSLKRAQAVTSYLVKAGAEAQQLEAVGFGSSRPAARNDTVENKAKNRRIEIIVRRP